MNHKPSPAWRKPPGSSDPLHLRLADYSGSNYWDIPQIIAQPKAFTIPDDIFPLAYRQPIRTQRPLLIHFHTDDYRFESCWNEPARAVRSICRPQVYAACSPDFSLYANMPLTTQLWNTYRNRWLACYLQDNDAKIIPTVNWSTPESYNFCFLGVEKHQIITIRSYTNNSAEEKANFVLGYKAMIEAIEPRLILWFGKIPTECQDDIPKRLFPVGHVSIRDQKEKT